MHKHQGQIKVWSLDTKHRMPSSKTPYFTPGLCYHTSITLSLRFS